MAHDSGNQKSYRCSHKKVQVRLHSQGYHWHFEEGLFRTSPVQLIPVAKAKEPQ